MKPLFYKNLSSTEIQVRRTLELNEPINEDLFNYKLCQYNPTCTLLFSDATKIAMNIP